MADNRKYYYLKLKENFFDSDDMIILESMPDGLLYSNILLKLYLKSLKNNGYLMFNDLIPYSPQMIGTVTRHQVGTVEKALDIFQKLKLIEILDNGAIYMMNIENFVGKSSSEGDRKRLARSRLKQLGQMSDERPPEIELEKELEKEKEKETESEKDKDINIDTEINTETKKETESEVDKDNFAADVAQYYQSRIGVIDGQQYQQLIEYVTMDHMEPELVKRAIDKAANNAKRNFGYINRILKNWAQNGIKTRVQQDEDQRRFNESKGFKKNVDPEADKEAKEEWGF